MPSRTGAAMAQYGHSKSPYSRRVTGAFGSIMHQSASVIGVRCIRSSSTAGLLGPRALNFLERVEDDVDAGRHGRVLRDPGAAKGAGRVDEEERAIADAVLFEEDAVLAGDLPMRPEIAQERETDVLLLGPGLVRPHIVDADGENLRVVSMDVFEGLLNDRQLVGAHGGPIGRVKGENDVLAAIVFQAHLLLVAVL